MGSAPPPPSPAKASEFYHICPPLFTLSNHPCIPARRVALLVDGENLPAGHAATLLLKSACYGTPSLRRVYGNVTHPKGWTSTPGFKPVHSGTGKNAADLLMAVQAMALMLQGQAEILTLASSDGDFTHLAQHLTEQGLPVIGIGSQTAPEKFRKSCAIFHKLAAGLSTPPPDPMIALTRALLANYPAGLPIIDLSTPMKTTHQITTPKAPLPAST